MTEAEQRKRANAKARYMEKQARGVCVECGKADERTRYGAARCAECNEKYHPKGYTPIRTDEELAEINAGRRTWYKKKRDLHVCVNCGAQDAKTLDGFAMCSICAKRRAAWSRGHRPESRDLETQRERRQRWRESGLCSNCGAEIKEDGYKTCLNCRVRNKLSKIRTKARNGTLPRGTNGRCYQCNKKQALPGKKLCAECYAKRLTLPQIKKAGGANDE